MSDSGRLAAFLRGELQQRLEKNSAYSLRAFARDLGLTVSHLSMTLSGQKRISAHLAEKVAQRLKLDELRSEYLILTAELEFAASPILRRLIEERIRTLDAQLPNS